MMREGGECAQLALCVRRRRMRSWANGPSRRCRGAARATRRRDDAFENSNTTTRDAHGVRFYIPVTFARTSFCDPRKLGFSLRLLSTALLAQLAERTPLKKTRRSREFILSPSYRKTIACGHGFEPHGGYDTLPFLRLSFLFLICRHKKVYLLGTGDAGCTPCSIRHVCISRPRTRAACNTMVVASSGVPRLTNHVRTFARAPTSETWDTSASSLDRAQNDHRFRARADPRRSRPRPRTRTKPISRVGVRTSAWRTRSRRSRRASRRSSAAVPGRAPCVRIIA